MNYTITVPLTLRGEDVEAQVEFEDHWQTIEADRAEHYSRRNEV